MNETIRVIRAKKFDFGYGRLGYKLVEKNGKLYLVLEEDNEIEFSVDELIREVHEREIPSSWRVLTDISLKHEPLISVDRIERVLATCHEGIHYTVYVVLGAVYTTLYYLYVLVSKTEPELSKALCS